LTTKMLASTVQFSTNDQPTTINTPHQTPTLHTADQAVCEARSCLEKKQPHPFRGTRHQEQTGCSLRTQQGAHHPSPAAPPRTRSTGTPHRRRPRTRCDSRCRLTNSPVSPPIEHPTTTSGQCGLLHGFHREVAP
jgi:hypothetical protein